MTIKVGIIAGTGYVGGELLRFLLKHPNVEVSYVTSRSKVGEFVYRVHPNLRGFTDLRFEALSISKLTDRCDIVLSAAPHGSMLRVTKQLLDLGMRVIDLSADYRLKNPIKYVKYYGFEHPFPELLEKSIYGLPELHRNEIKRASLIACPGCIAVASILALAPLVKNLEDERLVIDAMVGSSAGGSTPKIDSHHAERSNVVRPYKPVGHRHTAEIEQELSFLADKEIKVALSTFAVDMVRGILSACHFFTEKHISEKDIWKNYREFYRGEPFILLLKDQKAKYKLPDPKITIGTNLCCIGFELDLENKRIVCLSAIDNLVKGAAGNAIQCLNIMIGEDEITGLGMIGPHPV